MDRAVLLSVAVLAARPLVASADPAVSEDFRYAYEQVWNTAIRLVRLDLESRITDRDQDAGYVLFEYPQGSRRFRGSIELVRTQDEKQHVIRVIVQLPQLPRYVSSMVLQRLARKLANDYGPQPRRTRAPSEADPEPAPNRNRAAERPKTDAELAPER